MDTEASHTVRHWLYPTILYSIPLISPSILVVCIRSIKVSPELQDIILNGTIVGIYPLAI